MKTNSDTRNYPDFSIRRWAACLGGVCCALLAATAILAIVNQQRMIAARGLVLHAYAVIAEIDAANLSLFEAGMAYGQYQVQGNPVLLRLFKQQIANVHDHLQRLRSLISSNPDQIAELKQVSALINEEMAQLDVSAKPHKPLAADDARTEQARTLMLQINMAFGRMKSEEQQRLLVSTTYMQHRTDNLTLMSSSVLAVSVIVAVFFFYFLTAHIVDSKRWHQARVQEEALEHQRQFRLLFEWIPDLAWSAQSDGSVDFYNKRWVDYTGMSEQSLQGWGWTQALDPETLGDVIERWRQCIKNKTAFRMIFAIRRHDGIKRWFLTRINPILDANNEVIRWIALSSDIDDQTVELRSLNLRLRSTERRLTLALAAVPMGVWEFNPSTGYLWRTESHDRIFGYESSPAKWDRDIFLQHVLEEDRPSVAAVIDAASTQQRFSFKCRIRWPNKTIHWIEVNGQSFFDAESNTTLMAGTTHEVTDHMHHVLAREQLAAIVESTQDAIITVDLQGTIRTWNKGAQDMYGFSAQEILGKPAAILAPDWLKHEPGEIVASVLAGENVAGHETKRITKTGNIIDVSLTASAIRDNAGKVDRICIIGRDITSAKQAHESLQTSKDYLETLFENAPVGILVADAQGMIRSVNRVAQEILGGSSDLIVGERIQSFLHTNQPWPTGVVPNSGLTPQGNTAAACYGVRLDGSVFPACVELTELSNQLGNLSIAMVHDLTQQVRLENERQRLESALKAQDISLRSPSIDPGLLARARALSVVLAALCLMLSMAAIGVSLIANPWRQLWLSSSNYISAHAAICLALTSAGTLLAHASHTWLRRLSLVAGAIILAAVSTSMLTATNVALLAAAISLISGAFNKMKLSQLSAFVCLCIGLVAMVGHTYGFTELFAIGGANAMRFSMSIALILSGIALITIKPQEGTASVFVSPSSGGKMFRRLLPVILLVPALVVMSIVGRSQSEHLHLHMIVLITTILLPSAIWFVSIALDQLDRQKDQALERAFLRREELESSARQLQQARDQALQASNLKSAFVASISHELRTPLTGIIGNMELLLATGKFAPEEFGQMESVLGCSQALLEIVNDLLDLSKIESGKFSLESGPIKLTTLVESVFSTVGDLARRKGLKLTVDYDPKLPSEVVGDEVRLRQVLINLTNNAIKFTHEGEVCVRVINEPSAEDKTWNIRFEIADTGIGISEEDRHLLFKPFSQVDSSATRKFGGTGLGLFLSKSLVELMGGTIGVESTKGKGSVFWVAVPLGRSRAAKFIPRDTAIKPLEGVKSKIVLLVEDNMIVQRLVMKQLSSLGVSAMAASSGAEALEMVASICFDLILMDINLPDVSGLDITSQIRQAEAKSGTHVPIIAMTAAAMTGDREKCLASGMDDYLSKPVTIKQLKETIAHWLQNRPAQAS